VSKRREKDSLASATKENFAKGIQVWMDSMDTGNLHEPAKGLVTGKIKWGTGENSSKLGKVKERGHQDSNLTLQSKYHSVSDAPRAHTR
jgi:hypothetical protein